MFNRLMIVRRTPSHSVVAHIREESGTVTLERITPDRGPVPDLEALSGAIFDSFPAARKTVLAAMKALSQPGLRIERDRLLVTGAIADVTRGRDWRYAVTAGEGTLSLRSSDGVEVGTAHRDQWAVNWISSSNSASSAPDQSSY